MTRTAVLLRINGRDYPVDIEPHRTLLEVLREDLGLRGTKPNCLEGECGACTVMVDEVAVNSCLFLAVRAQGRRITTIEGLAGPYQLHAVQEAFLQYGALQCGYCTPGVIMAAAALLERNPAPNEAELVRGLAGNICRCTGYVNIRAALRALLASREAS